MRTRCPRKSSDGTIRDRPSRTFLRKLLLEGVLAENNVIDREELEPFLVQGQPFREEHLLPLLACVAAEVYVRKCIP